MDIGETTALVAEASTLDEGFEIADSESADTGFPDISAMKGLTTVGEVGADTGLALTGWPDGNAAWLLDDDTVRVAYQSEAFATMSTETHGWAMNSGVKVAGSHIHTLGYNRAGLASFLDNDDAASSILESSDHLFNTFCDVFGDEVLLRAQGGILGNQARPVDEYVQIVPNFVLENGDLFSHSFYGSDFEPANTYGAGIGLADDVWMNAEEWNIQRMFNITEDEGNKVSSVSDTNSDMRLASIGFDIANETACTLPALGQTAYEKLTSINPQHPSEVLRRQAKTLCTSADDITVAYFCCMSNRLASCGPCARSPTQSEITVGRKFALMASTTVARTHPLVVTPATATASTFLLRSSEPRLVSKKAEGCFLRMTTSPSRGFKKSTTWLAVLASVRSRSLGAFSHQMPASDPSSA